MHRNCLLLLTSCGLLVALGAPRAGAARVTGDAIPPEIAAVAADYANALAVANAKGAWDLLSSQSRAEVSAVDWQEVFARRPPARKPPATSLLRAIASADSPPDVGDALVRTNEAFVAVKGTVRISQQYVLVRESVGWRVDLRASDRLNSSQAARDFLDVVSEDTAASTRTRPSQELSLPLLRVLLAPEAIGYRVVAADLQGDTAHVTAEAEVPVNLVLRVTRSGAGWAVDLARPLLPLDASAPQTVQEAAAVADKMTCEQQLTQLARGIQMYAASSDDMLPDPSRWLDQISPFLPQPDQAHCPEDPAPGVSYAMNRNLAGKRLREIANPTLTVLLYESTLHSQNPADAGESWATPPRHAGGDFVAYADGSVRTVPLKPSFEVKVGAPGAPRVIMPGRAPGQATPPRRPAPAPSVRPR